MSEVNELLDHYYVKPYDSSQATTGVGTEASPVNGFVNLPAFDDGETLELTAGVFTEELIIQNVQIAIKGQGQNLTIIDGENTRSTGITVSSSGSANASSVEDLRVRRTVKAGVLLSNDSSVDYTVTVSNVTVHNLTQSATSQGNATGFLVDNTNNVYTTAIFEDCTAYDCGRMGFDTQQFQGYVEYNRCEAYRCGTLGEGGGFYTHAWRNTKTTGWTDEGGGVYSRATASVLDGCSGIHNKTTNELLVESDPATTTPAAGEWSLVGTTIYANFSVAWTPNSDEVIVSRANISGLVQDCISWANGGYDALHGTGYHIDDMSEAITLRRCRAENNGGKGLSINLARDITVIDCYFEGNGQDGTTEAQMSNINIKGYNVTLTNCTSQNPLYAHIAGVLNPTPAAISKCIFDGGQHVLWTQTGADLAADDNYLYGYTGAKHVGSDYTSTNEILDDPLIDSTGRHLADSPATEYGANWWTSQGLQPSLWPQTYMIDPAALLFDHLSTSPLAIEIDHYREGVWRATFRGLAHQTRAEGGEVGNAQVTASVNSTGVTGIENGDVLQWSGAFTANGYKVLARQYDGVSVVKFQLEPHINND